MAHLELSEQETAFLTEILESSLSELKTERVRTDNRQLHARFVQQEKAVEDILNVKAKTAHLELTEQETVFLTEILESSLSELKTERVRTDNRQLHARFVQQEKAVEDILKRLEGRK